MSTLFDQPPRDSRPVMLDEIEGQLDDLARIAGSRKVPLDTVVRVWATMERAQEIGLWKVDIQQWHHIFDLQTEVSFHEPASPPYGRRSVERS
jgi:hypothetical protein